MTRNKDNQIEDSKLRYGHNLDDGRFSTVAPDYDAEQRRKAGDAEDIGDDPGEEDEGEVDNGRDAGTDDVNRFSSDYDPSIAGPPGREGNR